MNESKNMNQDQGNIEDNNYNNDHIKGNNNEVHNEQS